MPEENNNQNTKPPLPSEKSDETKPSGDPQLPQQLRNLRPPMPPKGQRGFMGAMLIIMLLLFGMMFYNDMVNPKRKISMTQFWTYVDNNQLTGELKVHPDSIEGRVANVPLAKDQPAAFYVDYRYETDQNFSEQLMVRLRKAGSKVEVVYPPASWWSTGMLQNLIFTVVLFGLLWFFLFRKIGTAGGAGFLGNFGRSRHRMMTKEQSKIKFSDVAGIDDAKDEVAEIVEFLKNPGRFSRLGGRVPRGVLLIGPPGCGKTMLAKAIAGEADVPFFSISGSDFVEMFVGVGASRVRDLFKQAKDPSPCIIFLDE
ncbi:MAG TPA: AAA family ATPase, partial [Phycisphaerae bacterium]|nr:AAA family ATPase [Phycisphaerae bacterium]